MRPACESQSYNVPTIVIWWGRRVNPSLITYTYYSQLTRPACESQSYNVPTMVSWWGRHLNPSSIAVQQKGKCSNHVVRTVDVGGDKINPKNFPPQDGLSCQIWFCSMTNVVILVTEEYVDWWRGISTDGRKFHSYKCRFTDLDRISSFFLICLLILNELYLMMVKFQAS